MLRNSWLNLALLLALFLALLQPFPVAAHLDLTRSEPEDGAILDEPPDRVRLWFGGELDTFESSTAVFDARGRQVDLGDAEVNLEERTLLQVSLPDDLPPGAYTIRWTAVSDEDAHPIDGELTFTIAGMPETVDVNRSAMGIAAVVGAGILVAAWFWKKRGETR